MKRKINLPAILAAICFIVALAFVLGHKIQWAGPALISAFVFLGWSFQSYSSLKGYTYTAMIFACVITALYYPQYLVQWGNFKLAVLIPFLIQIIMFGMGTSMSFNDFVGVIKMPKGVFIGVTSHFIIMPLLGFTLASLSGLPAEIAAGMILLGCSPNGMASNVISYLAKANLALSITITAISTLLAPFLTPLLMKLLAHSFIEIDVLHMMWDISKMVIIPVAAGLLFNYFFSGKVTWLDKAMPLVSMIAIAFSIVVIIAAGRDSLLTIGPLLLGLLLVHNLLGYFLGYWFARIFKMSERDCRTVAIEVGMQNAGLASGIAKEMGKLATIGLAPAVFGSMMNITGSVLASWWHKRPPEDPKKAEDKEEKLQKGKSSSLAAV
jgi:BASS family bile acid:Na+ symporter